MQATETVTTNASGPVIKPDLDMSHYIPDWLQPLWDFFTPYPGLLTLLLIAVAYAIGKLLRFVISKSMMKVAAKTSTTADDHLIEYLTRPLVLTTVTLAMMMVVSVYRLPQGLQDATLSLLGTILLFSWAKAGLRTARILLELVASNHHRIEIVQERTIPFFNMTIKILLVGRFCSIFFPVDLGDQPDGLARLGRCYRYRRWFCGQGHIGKPALGYIHRCRCTLQNWGLYRA